MKNTALLETIKNSRVAVLGFGVSNRPLIPFLTELGVRSITVHDKKSVEQLGEAAADLLKQGVSFVTGDDYLATIDADVIFRSPGIRDDVEGILQAVKNGAVLTSEMELFFALTPATVIGITGSDGKTTTTTLCAKILEEELKGSDARVYLGGNIGEPLLPRVKEMTERDFAVVELSSFQLKTMGQSPSRAVITNLSPNHLDWHTGMDEYIDSKFNICRHAELTRLVTNAENEITAALTEKVSGEVTLFSSKRSEYADIVGNATGRKAIFERDGNIVMSDGSSERVVMKTADIKLLGRHNVENYMAAIGMLDGWVSDDSILQVARTFGGVAHRMEFVRTLDGVSYYNSSIDSSPTRTAAALTMVDRKPIVICGGYDKHIPFAPLGKTLCERAKAVVLTGATAGVIREAIESAEGYKESGLSVVTCAAFEDAVTAARQMAVPGDIVILSPACASFDAFVNFEARGNAFRDIVNRF